MELDFFRTTFLAILQGFTEFLPISSSAHIILPKELLGWPDQGLIFDVAVHVGSLIAVLLYFRRDIVILFKHDYVETGLGQVGGIRQSVVAGTDDNCVVITHRRISRAAL